MNGVRLRQLREDRGLTRKEVEQATGIDRVALYRYETNTVTNPPVVTVAALAKFYGVAIEELLEE